MPTQSVRILPPDPDRTNPFGPATIEHRTAQAQFGELGTYLMKFIDDGHTEPWTVQYEESMFVVAGEASLLVVDNSGQESEVRATAGDLIAIPKPSTVRYGGTAGTELLLSIAPVNWRDQQAASQRRVLFLTPFHFNDEQHDHAFDAAVTELFSRQFDGVVVADHVGYFESDDDYDAGQVAAVVESVQSANEDGYDAIVIACHYDPAVAEARAASRVPVLAPLQLTCGIAAQYGPRFAVITDIEEAVPVIGGLVNSYGYGEACVGVSAIGWEGDAILDDTLGAAKLVDALVADLAASAEVQSVVIGCTIVSTAYETHRDKFPDRGVVVLNSNLLSLKGAAALADL